MNQTTTTIFCLALSALIASHANAAGPGGSTPITSMDQYQRVLGLEEDRVTNDYRLTILGSNRPGHVFFPGEEARFEFQIENLTDKPLQAKGEIEIIRYAQLADEEDRWHPRLQKLAEHGTFPLSVNLDPGAWGNYELDITLPEIKGGYALIVDLGPHGRKYLCSATRVFKYEPKRIAYPVMSTDGLNNPKVLARLGIQTVRTGVKYHHKDSSSRAGYLAELEELMNRYHEAKVMCTAEFATGNAPQPTDHARRHLTEHNVQYPRVKPDLAWLPEVDDDFEQYVYELMVKYGYPNGPINGVMLWNEPWEGSSISGWGSDMIRYREIYKRIGDAVMRAREDAGVEVLIGGCDSTSNTFDKLLPRGFEHSDMWPKYLDFMSVHYQSLHSSAAYREFRQRKHYKGRVLIWDTESWTANSDDRYLSTIAAQRAAGYDRVLGSLNRVAISKLSHGRVRTDRIKTADGEQKRVRPLETRPLAAVYSAGAHFLGERTFREVLFRPGLPWVFVFEGLDGNDDDGTIVVAGDIATQFRYDNFLYNTVEPLPGREPRMIIDASEGFQLYDYYGNPQPSKGGRIVLPLGTRGYVLRGDPRRPGSFAKLIEAVRHARIEGYEPVEMLPQDLTAPIDSRPTLRIRMTNMLERPVTGKLTLTMPGLTLDYAKQHELPPRQVQWIEATVVSGEARADNTYPLTVAFDAGDDGVSRHEESMHVNVIHRKTITVDGALDDWAGAIAQPLPATIQGPTLMEKMWRPFESFSEETETGPAIGYVACDEDYFYFAAKIADRSPHPGTIRFAERDHDREFYPKVSYALTRRRQKELRSGAGGNQALGEFVRNARPTPDSHDGFHMLVWPDGVRRFSYRMSPTLPSGPPWFDNVMIAFNAIPLDEDPMMLGALPGVPPKYTDFPSTDYEYALNKVADSYGGGTEVWRMSHPGMTRKHFYPRQPAHPREGAVENARLRIEYREGMRIVEAAIPWDELPHVKAKMQRGQTVKFSYRVNHNVGGYSDLAEGRSVAYGQRGGFHPGWRSGSPNELEFGFERPAR